jgi:membrane-associated protein
MGLTDNLGYLALAGLIGGESMGIPLPGETALIAAGLLAHSGKLEIELVILIAAAAAIIGDNIGYVIGRKGGRKLLEMPGPLEHHRRKVIEHGQPFFDKHGPKAVFFGRWFAGLRIAAAWLAGINHMDWRSFLLWNALGGIVWATAVGLGAYFGGAVAEQVIQVAGIAGLIGVVAIVAGLLFWRWRRERAEEPSVEV